MNMEVAEQLTTLYRPLANLLQQLDDTIMSRSSRAYTIALDYYHLAKRASASNVTGAKSVYQDLRKHFMKDTGVKSSAVLDSGG